MRSKPRVRVFNVSGRRLLVYRVHDFFCASFTWAVLMDKVVGGRYKPINDTLRERWEAGHG